MMSIKKERRDREAESEREGVMDEGKEGMETMSSCLGKIYKNE